MGIALQSLEAPVMKDTNSLVCLTGWEHKPDTPGGVCIRCGKCVAACPNSLIELVPYRSRYRVQCSSNDKGKAVREACDAGCIACRACERACEYGAVIVENNLARIDSEKCVGCGACAEKCPTRVIRIEGK